MLICPSKWDRFLLKNCFYVSWILPFLIVYPEWGSAGQTYNRFLPNAYQDGTSEPRGGRHPSSLPNPRWVSQRNHPDSDIPDYRFTHMVMQFGQFLDHDITMTPKDGKWWEVAWFCFANIPNKRYVPLQKKQIAAFLEFKNQTALLYPYLVQIDFTHGSIILHSV